MCIRDRIRGKTVPGIAGAPPGGDGSGKIRPRDRGSAARRGRIREKPSPGSRERRPAGTDPGKSVPGIAGAPPVGDGSGKNRPRDRGSAACRGRIRENPSPGSRECRLSGTDPGKSVPGIAGAPPVGDGFLLLRGKYRCKIEKKPVKPPGDVMYTENTLMLYLTNVIKQSIVVKERFRLDKRRQRVSLMVRR